MSVFVILILGFSLLAFIAVHNTYPTIKSYVLDPYHAAQSGDGHEDTPSEPDQLFKDEYTSQ